MAFFDTFRRGGSSVFQNITTPRTTQPGTIGARVEAGRRVAQPTQKTAPTPSQDIITVKKPSSSRLSKLSQDFKAELYKDRRIRFQINQLTDAQQKIEKLQSKIAQAPIKNDKFVGTDSQFKQYQETLKDYNTQVSRYNTYARNIKSIESSTPSGRLSIKPPTISKYSQDIAKKGKYIADTIRKGEPILMGKIEKATGDIMAYPLRDIKGMPKAARKISKELGKPTKFLLGGSIRDTAGLIEDFAKVPGGTEILAKRPGQIPNALIVGAVGTYQFGKNVASGNPESIRNLATGILLFHGSGKVTAKVTPKLKTNINKVITKTKLPTLLKKNIINEVSKRKTITHNSLRKIIKNEQVKFDKFIKSESAQVGTRAGKGRKVRPPKSDKPPSSRAKLTKAERTVKREFRKIERKPVKRDVFAKGRALKERQAKRQASFKQSEARGGGQKTQEGLVVLTRQVVKPISEQAVKTKTKSLRLRGKQKTSRIYKSKSKHKSQEQLTIQQQLNLILQKQQQGLKLSVAEKQLLKRLNVISVESIVESVTKNKQLHKTITRTITAQDIRSILLIKNITKAIEKAQSILVESQALKGKQISVSKGKQISLADATQISKNIQKGFNQQKAINAVIGIKAPATIGTIKDKSKTKPKSIIKTNLKASIKSKSKSKDKRITKDLTKLKPKSKSKPKLIPVSKSKVTPKPKPKTKPKPRVTPKPKPKPKTPPTTIIRVPETKIPIIPKDKKKKKKQTRKKKTTKKQIKKWFIKNPVPTLENLV